ncbi:MAG: hypothetical protein H0W30_15715 [Gemmatimonadaceae bacterium]|nr:hypothetical protein [Gemmatimonadaceae bacterium]
MTAAGPAVPIAETVVDESPVEAIVNVCVPRAPPSVQVADASPWSLVISGSGDIEPPEETVTDSDRPVTGLPC